MKEKHILVVGASSGIGQAVAQQLQEAGAVVYTASRSSQGPNGDRHTQFNVTDPDWQLSLPEQLHGVVYCPGTITLKPFQTLKPEQFRQDFEVNALGAARVLQQAYKPLRAAGHSSVVLFSTVAVNVGMNYHASVAMAKGALEGLARSLAAEWAQHQIRINVVAPSLTDTPLAGQLLSTEEKRKASGQRHPLGRVGTADEIAQAALYLLSPQTSWMTGQTLHLDGGLSSIKPM